MKTKLLTLFIVAGLTASAQAYHPTLRDSVQWTINYFGFTGYGSDIVRTTGDTIVNGVTYKKVKEGSYTFLYHEDTIARKIYIRRTATQTDLLYNYSLNLNDSIMLNWYDPIITMTWYPLEFKVDSVSQTSILSGTRKFIRLHATQSPTTVLYWLESVGNLYDLSPLDYVSTCPVDCGIDTLVCQQERGVQTFQLSPAISCGTAAGIEDITNHPSRVIVYPNPAQERFTLSSPVPISEVVVSDLMGRVIYTNVYNDREVSINTTYLPAGIYIVKANEQLFKVVKQ